MRVVRFANDFGGISLGVIDEKNNQVIDITAIDSSLTNLISLHTKAKKNGIEPSKFITNIIQGMKELNTYDKTEVTLLTPVEAPEIWAGGVTYQDSRRARNSETSMKDTETFYDKVYTADRPELFLKSTDLRVQGPREHLYLRTDSTWQVPEPELCLVITSDQEIVGYTIGNDMSSRDIEGENPLYLPQAKIWEASCSFGPAILLADTVEDPYNFDIICKIIRESEIVFEGTANTSELNRTFDTLIDYLFKDNIIFDGTVLMTGTSIVPPDEFTLRNGDTIKIEIPPIGTLVNHIAQRNN